VGEIRVYIDKNFVHKREKQLAKGGIVPGAELASAFSSLRANDLVWPYVVANYLKGQQPPAFVFAAREDHIVPWKGAYESARYLGGPVTFVLGASGHIAGSINSAYKNKRSYWVNDKDKLGADADRWFAQSAEVPGSWWNAWAQWLKPYGGKLVAASEKLGDAKHKPIEPAPGRYVKERADYEEA
jgi:polyhydroxyalkanoate synthase